MIEGYSYAWAEPDRDGEVAALLETCLGASRALWRERFAHWDRNPARAPDQPRGWVALAPDGAVAGFLGNVPVHFVSDEGEALLCHAAHTLGVRPQSRGMGIGLQLAHQAYRGEADVTLAAQMNAAGFASGGGTGAFPLGQEWTREGRIVVADPAALLRRAVRLPHAVACLVAAAARLAGTAVEPFDRPVKGLDVAPLGEFDAAEDGVLACLVARPARYRQHRDARLLNWAYFGTPALRRSRLVLAARRHGRLVGYAGFRLLPASLALLECRTLPGEEAANRALVRAARRWAKRARLGHILVYPYSAAVAAALPPVFTFRAPGRPHFTYLIVPKKRGLAADHLELGPWDGDAVFNDDAPVLDDAASG